MGYAFLYGVFGALLGANVGAFLYDAMLTPLVGRADAAATIRLFWLVFVGIDALAVGGLWFFSRALGKDTPATRARARLVMTGVYGLILLLGCYFLYGAVSATPTDYKAVIEALIFQVLGLGGLYMNNR